MKRTSLIALIIVAVFALGVIITATWFDRNWHQNEIIGDESPSWQGTQATLPAVPEASESANPEQESEEDNSAYKQNIVAPGFTVYNAQGNPVQLSDFLGKPVVLNFWASWCSPCKNEMPEFQKLYLEYGDEVQFLMVNLTDGTKETVESASDFLVAAGYTFPVYFDVRSEATTAYSIRSIPTTFFIDAEGYAIAQATGAIDEATLQKGINLIYTPSEEAETTE